MIRLSYFLKLNVSREVLQTEILNYNLFGMDANIMEKKEVFQN